LAIKKDKIGILGTGSWGNTLAFLLGQTKEVVIWDRDPERVRKVSKTKRFKKPLNQRYPDQVHVTADLRDLFDCQIIINAISLKGMKNVFRKLKEAGLAKEVILINGSKGVEPDTLKTPTEIIGASCPNNPIAVISGPNLAKEMMRGKPMLTVVASSDPKVCKIIQDLLMGPTLRVYTSDDIKGVELAGAFKNIIAIAAGCIDGLELGESAKASLITRGLAEMNIFVSAFGGKAETTLSPAGIGDLVATCNSELSRNHKVGYFLAKAKKLNQIIDSLGEVAEGVNTTHAVYRICQEKNLQLPIVEQVKEIIDENSTAVEAVLNLMNRPVS